MSIEALAMAGADYTECGIKLESWERSMVEKPPAYLLAEDVGEDYKEWGINLPKWKPSDVEQPLEHLLGQEGDLKDRAILIQKRVDYFVLKSEQMARLAMANVVAGTKSRA